MKYFLCSFAALSLLLTFGCKKKDNTQTYTTADSMTLRYNGGYGPVMNIQVYNLTSSTVLEDTTSPPDGIFDIDLGNNKYNDVSFIMSAIPSQLLNENGAEYRTLEYPDAGGVQVTAYVKGAAYQWYFSDVTDGMAAHNAEFTNKLQQVHAKLK